MPDLDCFLSKRVESHILGLKRPTQRPATAEQAAEGGNQGALAGVGGGAEDYQEAGHAGEGCVQVYLPFGRFDFLAYKGETE
jgi:hypothetical protein